MSERNVDVAVIGAGTAGLVAVREIQKANQSFVLIQDGPYGTTCARVGCMPSKALIQIAHDYHRRTGFDTAGIRGGQHLTIDPPAVLRRVRELRDRFAGGMVRKTDRLEPHLLKGRARFIEPTVLEVDGTTIRAQRVVIATGSRPRVPPEWQGFGDRIWTSDTIFELDTLPASVAVIGLGVIGLELGQALARLGVRVVGVARSPHLGGLTDPVVRETAAELMAGEMTLWRGRPAALAAEGNGLRVTAGDRHTTVDAVLVATGRQPNVDDLGLERLDTPLRPDGVPCYDPGTLQVGRLPVFIAGDANDARPILHEAWDDGRIAGHNAACETPVCFQRRTPLHVVFSDPNIVMTGTPFEALPAGSFATGTVAFDHQARALIRNENAGRLHLYADLQSGRLLGAEMCAPAGEHLGHLLAWSIQRGETVTQLLNQPVYHPVIEEGLREAIEDLAGAWPAVKQAPVLTPCDPAAMRAEPA